MIAFVRDCMLYSVLEVRVLIFIDHAKLWGNYGVIACVENQISHWLIWFSTLLTESQHMLLSYVSIMLEKLCLASFVAILANLFTS